MFSHLDSGEASNGTSVRTLSSYACSRGRSTVTSPVTGHLNCGCGCAGVLFHGERMSQLPVGYFPSMDDIDIWPIMHYGHVTVAYSRNCLHPLVVVG